MSKTTPRLTKAQQTALDQLTQATAEGGYVRHRISTTGTNPTRATLEKLETLGLAARTTDKWGTTVWVATDDGPFDAVWFLKEM